MSHNTIEELRDKRTFLKEQNLVARRWQLSGWHGRVAVREKQIAALDREIARRERSVQLIVA